MIHRALRKRADDRFRSADAMREALAEASEPTRSRPLRGKRPEVDGATGIASREDFEDFDRHVRALRRGRILGPVTALALVAAGALLAWRWADAYALLAARTPSLAAALPAALRPATVLEGVEREPNDVPARANPLPIPPGPDGRPGGGVAEVRGSIGARLSDTSGDVDIYRVEVPVTGSPRLLVAEWRGDRSGEGIRGLDVALALNRERPAADASTSAPLVTTANRGGPGRPERLVALVEPGTYYLSVREVHDEATGPVEKPTDRYVLTVSLADPRPGEEIEPNDRPDRSGASTETYAAWRVTADRNVLAEGAPVRGDTGPDDPDLYAVAPRSAEDAREVVLAVPDPGLGLSARLWRPDEEDLSPSRVQDRVRFEDGGAAAAGQVLVVPVAPWPRADAPALLELRAAEGQGRYVVVALGAGEVSVRTALGLVRELVAAGRAPAAGTGRAGARARVSGRPGGRGGARRGGRPRARGGGDRRSRRRARAGRRDERRGARAEMSARNAAAPC